jgi:hypothetical protein
MLPREAKGASFFVMFARPDRHSTARCGDGARCQDDAGNERLAPGAGSRRELRGDVRTTHKELARETELDLHGSSKRPTKYDSLRHNVNVTGAHGQARPKGADARGRPC